MSSDIMDPIFLLDLGNISFPQDNITMPGNWSSSGIDLCLEMKKMKNMQPTKVDEDDFNRRLFTYYLMGLIGTCISSFGILGNIMSLIVIAKLGMRTTSTYIYLGTLAICDTLVCILSVILLSNDTKKPVREELDWDTYQNSWYPYLFPYVHPAALTFQVTSIWLTLAFTVDRYIMICHPFKAEKLCKPTRAWIVVSALLFTGIFFNIPRFFEYETHIYSELCGVRIVPQMTDFGRNIVFRQLFHSWFYLLFVCGLPFLALAVMNSFLMVAVHESRKRGREINAAERKRNDTTIMLIGVTVIFFTCQVPALVSRMLWAFKPSVETNSTLFYLNEIGNFLVALNSAINIVPYYFFGKRFRTEFWKVFCPFAPRLKRSNSLSQISNVTNKSAFVPPLNITNTTNVSQPLCTSNYYTNGNGYLSTDNGIGNDGQAPLIHINSEQKVDAML